MSDTRKVELDLADRQWSKVNKLANKYGIEPSDVLEVSLETSLEANLLEEKLQLFYDVSAEWKVTSK